LDGNREQRPSETEFVAVGINYVEETRKVAQQKAMALCRTDAPDKPGRI
jgi:hypothetical protein